MGEIKKSEGSHCGIEGQFREIFIFTEWVKILKDYKLGMEKKGSK